MRKRALRTLLAAIFATGFTGVASAQTTTPRTDTMPDRTVQERTMDDRNVDEDKDLGWIGLLGLAGLLGLRRRDGDRVERVHTRTRDT
jgi:MYXO-CTERM domain-containing protein